MIQRKQVSFVFGLLILTTLLTGRSVHAEEQISVDQTQAIEVRMIAMMDLIQEKHIDPPTRQEMILSAVKSLYRAQQQSAPKGSSDRVSKLSSNSDFAEYLRELRIQFASMPHVESVMLNGSLQCVHGSVVLFDAKQAKVQEQLAANRYVGIGIALAQNDGQPPSLMNVFYDGPGWKAGVRKGDRILEIDGLPTEGKALTEIVDELRGEEGTDVTLVVQQPEEAPRTLTIARAKTFIPTVVGTSEPAPGQWKYTVGDSGEFGYLRFLGIGPSTLHEFRQVATRLENVSGLVLDFRGGSSHLHDVVLLADALLDGGVIGHVRNVDSIKTYEARPGQLFPDIPVAVLVDKDIGAGRIWLTAALQDRGRAVVVGEPSEGETFVRSRLPVPGEESQVTFATGILYRGNGTPLNLLRNQQYQLPNLQIERALSEPTSSPSNDPIEANRRSRIIQPDYVVQLTVEQRVRQDLIGSALLSKAMQVLRNAHAAKLKADMPPSDSNPSAG